METKVHISRGKLLMVVVLMLGLFLAACAPATTAPDTSPPQDGETEQADEGTGSSGTMNVAMQPMVQTDPALISSDTEVLVANHVYDYLVDVSAENTIVPRLAKDWNVSPDGLTYTFNLEEGVVFHDGSPLTAKDVVWTFDRLRNPDSGFPTATLYENIVSITSVSDLQVEFKLKNTNPFFPYDLSDNHALIIKDGTTEASDFNGSGPYKVSEYLPEDRIILQANPDYWLEGKPGLAELQVIFFNDDAAMVDALRGGQVDLVMRLPTPLYQSLEGADGIVRISVPSNKFDVVRLRADRPPGDDPRVIQALRLATDKQVIFDLVLQAMGRTAGDNPIGPMYTQYHLPTTVSPVAQYDAARELLKEAGYEDNLKMELHTPDTENRPDLAVALKDMWAKAGVEVEVIVEPESIYYGDNGWLEVDLGITGWGSRPYPQFYLDVMLTCDAIWNEAHWCSKEFDALVEIAGTTLDETVRKEAYINIQKMLNEEGPLIIPYFSITTAAVRDNFDNFSLKSFPGRTDLWVVTNK